MKITLLLCMIAVLTGCPDQSTPKPQEQAKGKAKPGAPFVITTPQGGDSPIIISDGSTHVRYSNFKIKTESTVPHVIVADSGFTFTTLECGTNVTGCGSTKTITLIVPWTLDVLSTDAESNVIKVVTLKSTDATKNKIVANFHRNPIDPEQDLVTSGYTDIGQDNLPFNSGKLTNTDSTGTYPLACSTSPCILQIHYVCGTAGGC